MLRQSSWRLLLQRGCRPSSSLHRGTSRNIEHYPSIPYIQYEGPETMNPFAYRYYQADEMLLGKSMKDWTRFAVCYWHSFCGTGSDPFGTGTLEHPWMKTDHDKPLLQAQHKADAAFELISKLGLGYYTFHDRDIAPEGRTIDETNANLQSMADYLQHKQDETGIKLLWGTANLFSHPRYMHGAGTNPDVNVFCHGAAQIRKAMEITHQLGGENYVFWGGREGYATLLNTRLRRELDHMANFLRLAVNYRKTLGATYQLLIEPKPREPTKHQYDYDAMTVSAFLQHYGLAQDFKINVEPNHTTLAGHEYEHDLALASAYDLLGSVDCNTGDALLGWDTDQFLMDERTATKVMRVIVAQGGLAPGGLNFDAKVRRESTDPCDLALAHIGSVDCFAKGLRNAVKIASSQTLDRMVEARYDSWNSALGHAIERNAVSLEDLEAQAKANERTTNLRTSSGQQELYELMFHRECQN